MKAIPDVPGQFEAYDRRPQTPPKKGKENMADEPDTSETDEKATEHDVKQVADVGQVADVDETDEDADRSEGRLARWRQLAGSRRLSRVGTALVASAVIVATVAGLAGWLGFRAYQKHEAQVQRDLFVQIARQGAVNLTTINYTQVFGDVQRIIDPPVLSVMTFCNGLNRLSRSSRRRSRNPKAPSPMPG